MERILPSIQNELAVAEAAIQDLLKEGEAPVRTLLDYLSEQKGGLLRPKIVLLAAGMCGGVTEESHRAACIVEVLHQASLIHDDVVDNASERRSKASVNAVWDNKTAVLLGDNLLSRVLMLISGSAIPGLLDEVARTVRRLTEGEICQLAQRGNLALEEEAYDRIAYLKTASLIESAFRLGALSASASVETVEAMGAFGKRFGTAFQWKDDLKDFAAADGKGRYNDLREGEVTFPIIAAMRSLCLSERAVFRQGFLQPGKDETAIRRLADTVRQSEGWRQALGRLRAEGAALERTCLEFPPSPYRDDLLHITKEVCSTERFEPKEG